MKNSLLTIIFLAATFNMFAQEKGLTPLASPNSKQSGSTYAVVVGISDYQDTRIPDLRFADKDAEAFANFLRSPAGGALDVDHLKVLTNQNATAGRIAEALDGLIEQTREGDQVIIYFSGHGDVERKTVSQPGFLLAWDAPSQVYMGGGTYSLAFLQEVVATLSTQNLAKVIVITDACHAGKLSGSQIGGAHLTSANLARQYANEVKILSCQPNEFSQEGQQWGGGRGAFSFHLVEGLFGLADRNSDGNVTVGEIDRYLEDNVTIEVAPQSQVPMLLGNKTERLATVNEGILAEIKKKKNSGIPVFAATESRGLEDDVLASVDTTVREIYGLFKKALKDKAFFEPASACADFYYEQLIAEPQLQRLHSALRRNYAAALQDDAQQILLMQLRMDDDAYLSKKLEKERQRQYPLQLERASQILGEKHYLYTYLQSWKNYFEGEYLILLTGEYNDSTNGMKALVKLHTAIQIEPEFASPYLAISDVYAKCFNQLDSMNKYANLASSVAPLWPRPFISLAFNYIYYSNQIDSSWKYLNLAMDIDSTSKHVLEMKANLLSVERNYSEAERIYKEILTNDSISTCQVYVNLGLLYLKTKNYSKAESCFFKAIQLDTTLEWPHRFLGGLYGRLNRYDEAETHYIRAIFLDSSIIENYLYLGHIYKRTSRYLEAKVNYEMCIELGGEVYLRHLGDLYLDTNKDNDAAKCYERVIANYPKASNSLFGMAIINARKKDSEKAFEYLERAFAAGYSNLGRLEENMDLAALRELPEWDILIIKYFPNQVKD